MSFPNTKRREYLAEEFLGVEAAGNFADGGEGGAELDGDELGGEGLLEGGAGGVEIGGGGFEAGLVAGVDGDEEIVGGGGTLHGGIEDGLGEGVEAFAGFAGDADGGGGVLPGGVDAEVAFVED